MKFKFIIPTISLLMLTMWSSNAQSILDIYRVSNTTLLGTGRAAGTNTNLTGIGADFTTLSANPAGIAQYRVSEFMISPTVVNTSVDTRMLNAPGASTIDESNTKFKLPNMGIIIASDAGRDAKTNFTFGFGLNGLQSQNEDYRISGTSRGSIIERFAALADGYTLDNLDPYEGGPAYDAGALYQGANQPDDGFYFNDYELSDTAAVFKSQYINGDGRYNEMVVSGGINLSNKILLGATIGVPFYRYNEVKTYQEIDENDNVPAFENLVFQEYRNLRGAGINGKFGVIVKPVNYILIGAAVHSPSFVRLTDLFSTELSYTYTEGSTSTGSAQSPDGEIAYTITTPPKYSGSVGGIFGKYGFINAEVEYTDFSKGKMKIDSDNIFDKQIETEINDDVSANYKGVFKMNIGGEVALPNFRIRAGYGLAQSPFQGQSGFLPSLGFGMGYRTDRFILDLAYRQWKSEDIYYPYFISGTYSTSVERDIINRAIVATIGFKLY